MASADRVRKVEKHEGIALHRSAHVTQKHQRTRADRAGAAWKAHEVAAGPKAVADGTPQINPRPGATDPASRSTFARIPDQSRQRQPGGRHFIRGERRKIFPCEATPVAPRF